VRAACKAGLGLMVRTRAQLERGLRELRAGEGLPRLPKIDLGIYWGAQADTDNPATRCLVALLKKRFANTQLRRLGSKRLHSVKARR
jgi:hypothetical protein